MERDNSYLNPYISGVLIGMAIIAFISIMGIGFNVNEAIAGFAGYIYSVFAPDRLAASEFFKTIKPVIQFDYSFALVFGIFIGSFISALSNKRISVKVERGNDFSLFARVFLTAMGGLIVGFASQLGRGGIFDNAFTGITLLSTGGLVFVISALISGYVVAFLFGRQWND